MTIPTTNATRAEEGDVLRAGRRHGPAEAILVETAGAHEVPRTESHQTDPRVHESLDNNWLAIRCRLVGKCGLLACYTPLPVRHRRHPAVRFRTFLEWSNHIHAYPDHRESHSHCHREYEPWRARLRHLLA